MSMVVGKVKCMETSAGHVGMGRQEEELTVKVQIDEKISPMKDATVRQGCGTSEYEMQV